MSRFLVVKSHYLNIMPCHISKFLVTSHDFWLLILVPHFSMNSYHLILMYLDVLKFLTMTVLAFYVVIHRRIVKQEYQKVLILLPSQFAGEFHNSSDCQIRFCSELEKKYFSQELTAK